MHMSTDRRIARREDAYFAAGDYRKRCEQGHLICEGPCGACACDQGGDWEVRVRTDKLKRSLCRECRYEADTFGNW